MEKLIGITLSTLLLIKIYFFRKINILIDCHVGGHATQFFYGQIYAQNSETLSNRWLNKLIFADFLEGNMYSKYIIINY